MSISTTAISVSSLHHHFRVRRPCTFSRATPPQIFSPRFLTASDSGSNSSESEESRWLSPRFLCLATASDSGSNSGESEESRWLREEQRWLREEKRWFREESRWNSERESLLREISTLRLRLQQLESESGRDSVSDSLSQIASVLQTEISFPSPRSDPLAISSSSSSPSLPPAADEQQNPTAKEENEKEDLRKQSKAKNLHSKTLRTGSEGDEVRAMQEALQKLGFYSGEEDMEYSTFSAGTELAVKTWQASIDIPEDGIMTGELLNRLYSSDETDEPDPLGNSNGAALASVTESVETQQIIVKKEEENDKGVSQQRVFLLGENRWEEPSRLIGNDKQGAPKKVHGIPITCIACRGEGRLMCTECDGTGEPKIEPQFLEWVDEGTKCTYCEGLGHTPCDICDGKSTA